MRLKRAHLCEGLLFLVVAGALLWWVQRDRKESVTWIAHALGGVGGKDYTNSLEAFRLNYELGYRIFEIDLMFTADGGICAFHSLESMKREFGWERRVSEVTRKEFLSQRYYERFTPLCLNELEELMDGFSDARWVLDVKESRNSTQADDLKNYRGAYRRFYREITDRWARKKSRLKRVIPQLYAEEDLPLLQSFFDFETYIFTLYRTKSTDEEVVAFVRNHPKIRAVAAERMRLTPQLASAIRALGRDVYVYTVNTPSEAENYRLLGVNGFYSDFLRPER